MGVGASGLALHGLARVESPGHLLAFVAMVFGAMNVVGGYAVTDRMLEMFKRKPDRGEGPE